jgi:protein-S-isoprenylcysteine O-methyltransferase Ste14
MKPYFLTHPVGLLYLFALLGWYFLELGQLARQQQWRQDATTVGPRSFWPAYAACVVAAIVVISVAPHAWPGADIGHPAAAFATGMVLLVAGAALRLWSFHTLGRYFTFTVKVSPDQPVVASGPYRVLRHPGYAGGLLAIAGIGLVNGNWIGMATIVLLWLALIVWRIRFEENALLTTLDGRYRAYASQHKRLVPLVW